MPYKENSGMESFKQRSKEGVTVFFTGLPGAGKTTIATALQAQLMESKARAVTLLDGDQVRRYLSSELGFSKDHRELNIRRVGFVAAEITRHGGICICALIAPYDAARREVRKMVESAGRFLLVHVNTPMTVCESRDPKGLYAKARAGLISHFTGVSDPYEPPSDADIVIDTAVQRPADAVAAIIGRMAPNL
jgi:sulfate adenylyltransferase